MLKIMGYNVIEQDRIHFSSNTYKFTSTKLVGQKGLFIRKLRGTFLNLKNCEKYLSEIIEKTRSIVIEKKFVSEQELEFIINKITKN